MIQSVLTKDIHEVELRSFAELWRESNTRMNESMRISCELTSEDEFRVCRQQLIVCWLENHQCYLLPMQRIETQYIMVQQAAGGLRR